MIIYLFNIFNSLHHKNQRLPLDYFVMKQETERHSFLFKYEESLMSSSLPTAVAPAAQVRRDLGVGTHTVVQTHHSGVVAEHGLVLHVHALHATVEHHITPHQLKDSKK